VPELIKPISGKEGPAKKEGGKDSCGKTELEETKVRVQPKT